MEREERDDRDGVGACAERKERGTDGLEDLPLLAKQSAFLVTNLIVAKQRQHDVTIKPQSSTTLSIFGWRTPVKLMQVDRNRPKIARIISSSWPVS